MLEAKGEHLILGPSSFTLEVLRDGIFTEKKDLQKPGGQDISTRLVVEGSGMAGLEDSVENKEWSGMFNHYIKTAGASLQLGRLLQLNGEDVNLQLMLDTVMVSHNGRRQFDEASWYPQEINNADERITMADTLISLKNLERRDAPKGLVNMVAVHGLGNSFPLKDTVNWNQKLPMYLDFRIAQGTMPMEQRFIDLQRGVVSGRYTQEFLDGLHQWAILRETELFDALHISSYEAIVSNKKNLKARINMAIKIGKFTEENVKTIKETVLFKPKSGQNGDMAEILGLTQDEFLGKLQLSPEDINEKMTQPERWEKYVRRLYVNDAEIGIFEGLSELQRGMNEGIATQEDFDRRFPRNSWWGQYSRELFEKRDGVPLSPREIKKRGIERAIEFYRKIESKRAQD